MSTLPTAPRIFFQLPEAWVPYTGTIPLSDTWRSQQGPGQVRELPAPGQKDMWTPHSVWYPVAIGLMSWRPMEGWEDLESSPASIEKGLQALREQLLEKGKAAAGCVGWVFLTALRCTEEEVLTKAARGRDLQSQEEALEAWALQLEEKLCGTGFETEAPLESSAEDPGEGDAAPPPQAQPIVYQKVKHEQPLGPGGVAACNPAVTEFTTYTPYSPTELPELGKLCLQRPGGANPGLVAAFVGQGGR